MTDISPRELNIQSPLAPLKGEKPEAPRWFDKALQHLPERTWTAVHGARIETLAWGDVGQPGLMLLHGNRAHADWWSFIAPFFADSHRVVAMSWSGMGGSDWREHYSIDLLSQEVGAVADATGLFEGPRPPVIVAHSFGGFPALRYTARAGRRVGGLVMVDCPVMSPEMRQARRREGPSGMAQARPNRVYDDLPSALARFRFAPPQVCKNLFIADHIARTSLKRAPLERGEGDGWTWRFDPYQWKDMRMENPLPDFQSLQCPVSVMWGSHSALFDAEILAHIAALAPAGSPRIEIPAARHHLMVDQPLAFVTALRGLLAAWPR
ncbi:MAG: alpha/beta hydrolase [Rhizobacter sp.]|nr:alpha/beta hydrolase [Rhizobacter sp.]